MNPRSLRVFAFIGDFIGDHDYAPSIKEIGEACDIPSTSSVVYHLDILEREGYIARDREIARSIRILRGGDAS